MQEKITKEQVEILKKSIGEMAKSDEQFFFMIFKNKNGTDRVMEYSFNTSPRKLRYYWQEALKKAQIQEDK